MSSLNSVRTQLNDVKNDSMCLGGTWHQAIVALLAIYRCLSAIDQSLQSVLLQIAVSPSFLSYVGPNLIHVHRQSTSRKGRERLEKDGIPYEPCMFPLATTIPSHLESFRPSDMLNVHQLFPSQEGMFRHS